jgi:putative colanic acid biosynthesis acetyltransferase WcaF
MLKTQLKKNFDKKNFNSGASTFKILLWYFTSVIFIRSGIIPFSTIIVFILRCFGAKIGKDVRIKPGIYIHFPWKLIVDDHAWLAECRIENLDQVTIGKNACVSQKAMLLTGNHNYASVSFDLITKPVVLNEGSWVGANATVCPGVTLQSHAVLTVGSVATKNLEPYSIYQGNPAVKIKDRVMKPKDL